MKIKTKITLKEYIEVVFIMAFRRKVMKYSIFLGIIMFLFSIAYLVGIIEATEPPFFAMGYSVVILFVLPISTYYSAKRSFNSHERIKEEIIYEFSEDKIKMAGESFQSEMTWDKLYKIIEMKNWFLFYQNKIVANTIPKNAIGNHLAEFREIIKKQHVKSKLKSN